MQDITREDAIAEGVYFEICPYVRVHMYFKMPGVWTSNPLDGFKYVWDSIYKHDESKRWNANPWVWVYEFERITL